MQSTAERPNYVDRGEWDDIIARHPWIDGELKAEYARWFTGVQEPLPRKEAAWRELGPSL